MRKTILLYNPLSGQRQGRRREDIETALSILRSAGIEASSLPTQSAADTTKQAHQAVATGCDTVFACGGDGTVHNVLQSLVGTDVALAIIPMGTANALAHDLGLPLRSDKAMQMALSAEPRRIAVGQIEYRDLAGGEATRYFTVTAGIGVDAHLFYKLNPLTKRRFGMVSYYLRATALWLTHSMEKFSVEYGNAEGKRTCYQDVTQLLAVRIRNFGGVLQELAPGASLERNDLRLVAFRSGSRLAYLNYVIRCLVGTKRDVRGIESWYGSYAACRSTALSRVFVEADGELLGMLPAKIFLVPDALTLLFPKR